MERFAKVLSLVSDLLATAEGVERRRHVREGLGPLAANARRPRASELAGELRRRHVQPGKKGGACVGKTKRGKGTKLMLLADGSGLPLAADVHSASPAEVRLIEPLLARRVLRRLPQRLIYDKAADCDALRQRLAKRGIDLISPHRRNRTRVKLQDGRKLRRYRRRWKIERSIAWLFNFRRLVVRYEHHAHLFFGLVQLACLYTTLRRF
jgi:transposase